jgi:hypothetical protein
MGGRLDEPRRHELLIVVVVIISSSSSRSVATALVSSCQCNHCTHRLLFIQQPASINLANGWAANGRRQRWLLAYG